MLKVHIHASVTFLGVTAEIFEGTDGLIPGEAFSDPAFVRSCSVL